MFYLLILLFGVLNVYIQGFEFPEPEIVIYRTRGFKISIPDDGYMLFAVHININTPLYGVQAGEIARDITRPKNGRWTYEDQYRSLQIGDKLYFWLHVNKDGLGYNLEDQIYEVTDFIDSVTERNSTLQTTSFPLIFRPVITSPSSTSTTWSSTTSSSTTTTTEYPSTTSKPSTTSEPSTTSKPECEHSETTMGGQPVCKGEVILNEEFDRVRFDVAGSWIHRIQIADDGECSCTILDKELVNSKTENGILKIKPTLLEDYTNKSFVLHGSLVLQGCSSPLNDFCERKASGWSILPPVVSARIGTKTFFSFKYGKVEIKAKFPRGDWIVPEILLEPKDIYYGALSGRIGMTSFGNDRLVCGGKEKGNSLLQVGFVYTNDDVLFYEKYTRNRESWAGTFHTYSMDWTPNDISFYVDGEFVGGTDPNIPLKKDLGTANIAPFDKEFFLTLGVHVGGRVDFPDDCKSNGRLKPWTNNDPKHVLNFWQDTSHWYSTWDSSSIFEVDYIKVTAL